MSIKDNLEKAAALFGSPNEPKCVFMTEETKNKIINETFDISGHEFSDKDLVANINGETIELEVTYQQWGGHIDGYSEEEKTVNINKPDAIAIAKALGVTGEDLL